MQERPPKWLRRALGARVIRRWEYRAIAALWEKTPSGEWMTFPKRLHPAAERIGLFEAHSPSPMLH